MLGVNMAPGYDLPPVGASRAGYNIRGELSAHVLCASHWASCGQHEKGGSGRGPGKIRR